MIAIGFTLQPEVEFLERLDPVLRGEPDYFEIAPETSWRELPDGTLRPNGFSRRFLELGQQTGRFFVAHGVGLSVGGASPRDLARKRRWLDQIALDQRRFGFRWYTDHLGVTAPDGAAAVLPLPIPMTEHSARAVRASLAALRAICPEVGVENSVPYFFAGDPLDEPAFVARAVEGGHLLLDLHNVLTVAENAGLDPDDYLARVDGSQVIEIHVSGGSYSAPGWLPAGRVMRLDGHDDAVPDEVFRMLERVIPRCPNLRGVTLERMEGTVREGDAELLRGELRQLRRIIDRAGRKAVAGGSAPAAAPLPAASADEHLAYERLLVEAVTARDPVEAARRAAGREGAPAALARWLEGVDEDGLRMAALLVAKLRFERLLRGSPEAEAWFEADAAGFTERFGAYHEATPLGAFFPGHEARLFAGGAG